MMDRRALLRGAAAFGCSAAAWPFLTSVTLAGSDGGRPLGDNRLVVIILRGAMDGLDVVQPVGDPDFKTYRKSLVRPDLVALDGFFGLHPTLGQLAPLWQAGELGFVHATSTPYRDKRSHFAGQDQLEAGTGMDLSPDKVQDGWLNRMLRAMPGLRAETAFAVGREDMRILRGEVPVMEWAPDSGMELSPQARLLFEQIYHDDPLFRDSGLEAMQLADMSAEEGMGEELMMPQGATKGIRLGEVDALVRFTAERLRHETRIASFSLLGWDTHKAQAGSINRALMRLERAILGLKTALGPEIWGKTAVLAMTEFGRTVAENGSGGTDHGTGSAMLYAGGALRGGQILGDWPGLREEALYKRRDLMPTSDVRAWAGQVMRGLYGLEAGFVEGTVFPGLTLGRDPGIVL